MAVDAKQPLHGTRRGILLAVIAAVITALLAGCGTNVPVIGSRNCFLKTDLFHESRQTAGSMGAKARIQCPVAVQELDMKVAIQKKMGTEWFTVDHGTWYSYGPTRANKKITRQKFIPCKPGTYRGVGYARIKHNGSWKTSNGDLGPAQVDPCR